MKKFLSAVIASAVAAVSLACPVSYAEEDTLGDCNGDGMINAIDASDILEYYASVSTGASVEWSEGRLSDSDVNSDGRIDSGDASVVLSYYSYLSTSKEGKNIHDYIELIKKFVALKPLSETVSDDGKYFAIEWDSDDEAEGYEIRMVHYFYDSERNYGNNEIVNTDVKVADGVSRIEIPLINLVNPEYREYDGWYYPTNDRISIEMKPYQIRNGEKFYVDSYYTNLNPYNITFMQQAKEPHDSFPVYNEQGETPYFSWTSYVSANDKKILEEFEKEHFTNETTFERIMYMEKWITENLTYASDPADWNEIVNVSYVDATLKHKKGQCIQYNGTLAAYAAYKGYDVKMIQGWVKGTTDWQHFWAVINFENGSEFELNLAL